MTHWVNVMKQTLCMYTRTIYIYIYIYIYIHTLQYNTGMDMGVSDSLCKHGTVKNNLTSSFGTKIVVYTFICVIYIICFHGHGQ